ncbi:uncharacterized protein MEPE_00939 [Melanopsichium pennsylvanicum]|uniref:Reverse transcriptase n=1 Tax=Melanopsichium pennsylvanicum TaxID=63383 RepID=A0AAJ4XHG8_9BASI|nr:uncharacterized protein MEPE_00939 [Melanopsichium pennsylvanicum]
MSTRSNRRNQTDASPQAEGDAPTISPSGDEPASVVAPSGEPPAALTTLVQGQVDILALLRETSEQQRRITALLEAAFFPREDQPRPESSQHYQGATAAQVPPPTVAPVYVEAAPREPEIRLQAPEWDGSQDKLEDFLDQCELNFEANPSKFPTDARRIMFAIGNMTGKPQTRIRNVRQQEGEDPPWMSSWRAFCADLRRVHGNPDPSYTARLQLNALRQKGSVSEHAAEFMSLTAKSHLTDQQQALMLAPDAGDTGGHDKTRGVTAATPTAPPSRDGQTRAPGGTPQNGMTSHDVLLGMDWIEAARPEPNYTLRTWDLRVPHTVTVPSNPKIEKNELHNLVGRRQLVSTEEDLLVLPEPEEELLPLRASATDLAVLPPEYREYADVFDAERADQLPPHRPHDHEINLEAGKTPPYGALYSLSHRKQEELRNYLRKMQAIGFIRLSSSQAAAPLLFVPKKDGRLRPCVDYRALNAITVKDRYPIPLISKHLDRLATAKIFTKFDLKGAYNLLRIAPGHEWKTAFRTRYGSYEYLVMPFGLCNAPATFQRLMNHVLSDLLDVSVIVYLDDILVFSDNEADHHHHVCQVLDRLRKHQLYCAPDKCEFHTDSVEFLGYLVSPDGLSMDPTKVSTVLEWPPPQSIRQIQVFLGFANFYRRFIRHYSRVAAPLTDLLKGGASGKVDLPPEATAAFNRLKEAFTSAPILRHFSPTLYTVVETDASDAVVAAVLSQWHPQPGADASAEPNSRSHTLHPVAYWLRKMIPAERNYEIHDKELLAIVDACGAWRHYLHGLTRPFLIYTDHQALQYFQTKRQLNRRQARWQADLAEFDFVLHYRPGKEAVRPDALSRRHDLFPDGPSRPDPANQATLLPANLFARAAGVHSSDPLPTEWIETLRKAANLPPNVAVRDGVPYTTEGHVYLPPQLRDKALHLLHDHPTAGHPGRKTTLHLMRQRFYWPTMVQDTDSYVASCAACRRAKHPRHKPHGYLLPSVPPDRPWSTITMDHITDLPPSLANGTTYNSILVVVDRLTKFVVFIPANKTDTAETLAYQLQRYVFSYFGLPDTIVSDRGTTFVASVWTELLRALRIKGSYSSAYHPQTNGQTERANQTLELFLRFYTAYDHSDWATLLPTAQLALNQRPSATTTIAPAIACFTFAPRAHPSIPPATSNVPSADKVRVCQDAIAKANLAVAKWFNRRRSDVSFRRGDLVLLRTKHLRSDRPSHKLSNPLAGPFKVDEVISDRAYRLLLPPSWKVHPVFHVQMLEPYPDGVRESSDAPQPTTLEDDYADFEVEGVLDSRRRAGHLQYKVSWVGYPPSWVPAEDVDRAPDLVAAYHAANPTKPAPTRR